ncbi:MAG: hypothetical protein IT372_04425 [Polyangiaceae bacterium]|nr:hypothetical protein [Polyangiaceae bacterium]
MLPWLLAGWETDVTARAGVVQSVASSSASPDTAGVLVGAQAAVDAGALGPRSAYGISAGGEYARGIDASFRGIGGPATDSVAGELAARGEWVLSPFTTLALDANGFLATELGVRASDELAARDPFEEGNRLQYTFTVGPAVSVALSERASLDVAAGYEEAGALAADYPEAVGADARTGRASVAYAYELGENDAIIPEVGYEYAHLYHALLDVDLRRGPADVHTASAGLVEAHVFSRRLRGRAGVGISIANQPPLIDARALAVSPEARLALTYLGRSYRFVGGYTFEHASLGPRIGYGQRHAATAQLSFRPLSGGRRRDIVVTGVARLVIGRAPVAADPPLATDPDEPPPSLEGVITTYTARAGARIDVPLAHWLVLTGGLDLQYLHATQDPAPDGDTGGGTFRTIWSFGLAGTISTVRHATVRRGSDGGEDRREPSSGAARAHTGGAAPLSDDAGGSAVSDGRRDDGRP